MPRPPDFAAPGVRMESEAMTSKTYYRQTGYEKWHLPCDAISADSAAAGIIFLTKCGRDMLCRDGWRPQAERSSNPPDSDICRRCEPERSEK